MEAFDYESQMHQSLGRQKAIGILSHLTAQRHSILSHMQENQNQSKPKHAVIVVIADDTNVWVSSTTVSRKVDETGTETLRKKHGMKKMQSLLGMLQYVFLRRPGLKEAAGPGVVLQLHSPSQLLPRANFATLRHRMCRWSVLCSEGCAEQYGGERLWSAFEEVGLKLIVHVADALPTNKNVQAAEQIGWCKRSEDGCKQGASTLFFETNCLSHQACLAKKPGLLQIDNLCSAIVRFTRAMRSSKFQDLFDKGLTLIASRVDRRIVCELPPSAVEWGKTQKIYCEILGHTFNHDAETISSIVNFFNGDWTQSFETCGSFTHFCNGCCSSSSDCIARARELLRRMFQSFPPVPLLYRWKGWEVAQDYIGLGILLHRFLPYLITQCCNSNSTNTVSAMEQDEDSADLSFALKQEVRLAKTLAFVTSENAIDS